MSCCEGQQREESVCQPMGHRLVFPNYSHFLPVVKATFKWEENIIKSNML